MESCREGCEFHLEKIHTHAHLDLIVWPVFFIWVRFFTLQYMWNMYASFHSLSWAPPKSLIRNREERGDPMSWWGIIHIERSERIIWGAKFCFDFKKSFEDSIYLAGRVWSTWLFMFALKNCDKETWRKTSAMKEQHRKSRGLLSMKWLSRLRHCIYRVSKHEPFILRNWRACVDTGFW